MSEPFVPAVGSLWWLPTTMMPPGNPEDQRVVAVLAVPASTLGTIAVVVRSGSGEFVRRVPVQCVLWTASNVTPIGTLDDAAVAALQARFGL
jgi:hypothetical protein